MNSVLCEALFPDNKNMSGHLLLSTFPCHTLVVTRLTDPATELISDQCCVRLFNFSFFFLFSYCNLAFNFLFTDFNVTLGRSNIEEAKPWDIEKGCGA